MTRFRINIDQMRHIVAMLDNILHDMRKNELELLEVMNHLDSSLSVALPALEAIHQQMLMEFDAIKRLKEVLERIIVLYIGTEKKIMAMIMAVKSSMNGPSGNNKGNTPQEPEKTDTEVFMDSLMEQYGFSEEDARALAEAFEVVSNDPALKGMSNEEKIHYIFKYLAALHSGYSDSYTYSYGMFSLFGLIGDTATTEDAVKYLDDLGLDGEKLRKIVENQHTNCSDKYNDFAHECAIIATMSNPGFIKAAADLNDNMDALIGYKGDVYSGSMKKDDIYSDITAFNLYNCMKGSDGDIMGAMAEYYRGIQDGSINEARVFLEAYGNGDAEKGMENLIKELDNETAATWKVSGGKAHIWGGGVSKEKIATTREDFLNYLTEQTGIEH